MPIDNSMTNSSTGKIIIPSSSSFTKPFVNADTDTTTTTTTTDIIIIVNSYRVCSAQTWPNWNGDFVKGAEAILAVMNVEPGQYQKGNTKVILSI